MRIIWKRWKFLQFLNHRNIFTMKIRIQFKVNQANFFKSKAISGRRLFFCQIKSIRQ